MSSHALRRNRYLTAGGVLLAVAGLLAVLIGVRAQHHAPQPPASAAIPVAVSPATTSAPGSGAPAGAPSAPAPAATKGPVLAAAAPLRLAIPAIGVDSDVHALGLNPDRTVQVPPLSKDSYAGWYKNSPAPGELGPAIILGHIDSAKYGPGVFYRLGALRQRDTISITRADHTVAVFQVVRVVEYPKDHFPTLDVYGNTDNAALRLITCGGKFDLSAHSYEDNIVAYASLVSSHPA
jgi:hypothetical protein